MGKRVVEESIKRANMLVESTNTTRMGFYSENSGRVMDLISKLEKAEHICEIKMLRSKTQKK